LLQLRPWNEEAPYLTVSLPRQQHEEAIQYSKEHFPSLCLYFNGMGLCERTRPAHPVVCHLLQLLLGSTFLLFCSSDIKRLMGALLHRDYSLKQSQYAKYLEDSEWFVHRAVPCWFGPLTRR
jgi:hypothetical protein